MKTDADKRKVMVLGGEEGLVFEVTMDGRQLGNVLEFKYLGFV